MGLRHHPSLSVLMLGLLAVGSFSLNAEDTPSNGQYPDSLLQGLQWRDVGPMRGGRSFAVAGVPTQPDKFYMGSVGGGVWMTENDGRTWTPIADQAIPIGSIGAIAVAPSDPDIIYIGTGEPDIRGQNSYGIGMFKSADGGRTWTHIGLEDTRHIGRIVVDPHDPNRVYVAALGHIYNSNPERGVFRSTDGGTHWKKVLSSASDPDNVGAIDIAIDPAAPRVLYASLWATRRPPWSVYAPSYMPGSGLYKSTDGGAHWTKLGGGLPDDGFVGKIGIAVAPSNPNRLWAVVDDIGASVAPPLRMGPEQEKTAAQPKGGVYISDDAGASWRLVNSETRLWGRGWYFEAVTVDPDNPDKAYVINTGTYVTTDAGKSFTPIKSGPGGDDYHQLWVNPRDAKRMVLSSDQGTAVSVDGGKTWSSWYNQPTAEIYHVAADNQFPYWLYGAQQDSGAVRVSTWSKEGLLNFRNWEPICLAGESNTVVPDPTEPNILYGGGAGRCNAALNVQASLGGKLPPPDPDDPDRKTWTLPEVFSPADGALYYSNQFVFRTRDRGRTWQKISPDLTRVDPPVPATLDSVTAKDIDEPMTHRFGVVYTISPSPLSAATIWVGTDDGLIQMTRDDGKTWTDVTPSAMTPWSKVSQVEAGHFDLDTAYASVDRHRLADNKPYIYRTHDGGKTWQNVTEGIPDGAYVNSVKEDPVTKGLLYAATELRVYVSFDDGDQWQSLQNYMPVTSVRDIVVHGDDLDIATHGRGFWVMDQMSALRQIAGKGSQIVDSGAFLFRPGDPLSVPPGGMDGMPMPHEEPTERNPLPGVTAYYWLKSAPAQPIRLELVDSAGQVRACAASDTAVPPVDTEKINIQAVWEEPAQLPPSANPGMHRYVLNLPQPRFFGPAQGEQAHDACTGAMKPEPPTRGFRRGPVVLAPGNYSVRLTVDGRTYEQPVVVKPDPRGSGLDTTGLGSNSRE